MNQKVDVNQKPLIVVLSACGECSVVDYGGLA